MLQCCVASMIYRIHLARSQSEVSLLPHTQQSQESANRCLPACLHSHSHSHTYHTLTFITRTLTDGWCRTVQCGGTVQYCTVLYAIAMVSKLGSVRSVVSQPSSAEPWRAKAEMGGRSVVSIGWAVGGWVQKPRQAAHAPTHSQPQSAHHSLTRSLRCDLLRFGWDVRRIPVFAVSVRCLRCLHWLVASLVGCFIG